MSDIHRTCWESTRVLESHPEHVFSSFFSSSIAVFFIAKPSSIAVFVVQTKWALNQEGRGHRSLIGVSGGIGRPHGGTLQFSEYKTSGEIERHSTFETSGKKMTTSTNLVSVHTNLLCV